MFIDWLELFFKLDLHIHEEENSPQMVHLQLIQPMPLLQCLECQVIIMLSVCYVKVKVVFVFQFECPHEVSPP
jgi:hypothetical protein